MRTHLGLIVALGSAWASSSASAAVPPRCGPDCTTPGRFVLCNDSFDTSTAGSGAIALDSIEWLCASFVAPTAQSFQLLGAYGAFAAVGGASNPTIFEARIYPDGPGAGPPGPQYMPLQNGNLQVPPAVTPMFVSLPLTPTYSVTGDFRFCLLNGLDDADMALLHDGDGITANKNFGNRLGMGWHDLSSGGVPGDIVLRALVQTTDMAPWSAGGECAAQPGADAGVADATGPDAMTMSSMDAAATAEDASTSADAGALADAASSGADASASGDDAATSGADASTSGGDAGIVAGPPPTIVSITPNMGANIATTAVIVSGTGFVGGAALKIGQIPAANVEVAGPTTIHADVPAGIVAGAYDVIVVNPDGQAAVLAKGFTVTGVGGAAPPEDGCDCGSTGEQTAPSWALGFLALTLWRARRRRA